MRLKIAVLLSFLLSGCLTMALPAHETEKEMDSMIETEAGQTGETDYPHPVITVMLIKVRYACESPSVSHEFRHDQTDQRRFLPGT